MLTVQFGGKAGAPQSFLARIGNGPGNCPETSVAGYRSSPRCPLALAKRRTRQTTLPSGARRQLVYRVFLRIEQIAEADCRNKLPRWRFDSWVSEFGLGEPGTFSLPQSLFSLLADGMMRCETQ